MESFVYLAKLQLKILSNR